MASAADLTLDELRLQLAPDIAAAAIFDGWTETALESAADFAKVDPAVARLAFPGGQMDMATGTVFSFSGYSMPQGEARRCAAARQPLRLAPI